VSKKPSRQFRPLGRTGQRDATLDTGEMSYRSLEVRSSSIDTANRTIDCDVSTENPVMMPDFSRMEMVPEILVTKGAVLPDSKQVPFLDSHQRGSVANQLGSARDVQTKYNRLTARLHFSTAADNEFTKVREGHVTDVSAGYQILKKTYVPAGEKKSIMGRDYAGPANVVTKWRLREVSLTPIGADDQAKLRGFDPSVFDQFLDERIFEMDPELKKLLVSRGMPADLDDAAAQKWLLANHARMVKEDAEAEIAKRLAANPPAPPAVPPTILPSGTPAGGNTPIFDETRMAKFIADEFEKARIAAEEKANAYRTEVDANCDLAGLPEHKAHCRSLPNLQEVRRFLQEENAKRTQSLGYGPSIRQIGSGFDQMRADMSTALTMRALNGATSGGERSQAAIEKVFPAAQRAKGADHFKYASLYDMAADWVRAQGIDVRSMSREDVAICAMFGADKIGARAIGGPVYNTTGGFTNLTLDAVNKSMMLGYVEVKPTWRGPMRQGTSAPDFKNINRIRMGAIPNLPIWNDNSNPEKATFADAREYYAVECRSLEIGFSYRLLVNDDMDALSRVPAMMGAAAQRTVNAVAWSQWTSNPTLQADGVALFSGASGNRLRSNLLTGANPPSVANLQTLTNNMRQMRGENVPGPGGTQLESSDILNLQPKYIIGPGALETTILQLVNSIADPAANQAGVFNTASYLTPIIEPLLDVNSTVAWYVCADPSQIDTIEVTFLQGQETPITRNFMDERTLSQNFTILQTFASKAMNHRGIQKAAGV